jgi:hypothetical protein
MSAASSGTRDDVLTRTSRERLAELAWAVGVNVDAFRDLLYEDPADPTATSRRIGERAARRALDG